MRMKLQALNVRILKFVGGLAWLSTSVALIVEPLWQPHFAPRTSSFHHHRVGLFCIINSRKKFATDISTSSVSDH